VHELFSFFFEQSEVPEAPNFIQLNNSLQTMLQHPVEGNFEALKL
jgi:hypothetical protein